MKVAGKEALFQPVKIDMQCGTVNSPLRNLDHILMPSVLFFKTQAPIEPPSFVQKICSDASYSAASKKTRFVQRLTPMTRMGKATEKGLKEVSHAVLAPWFHQEGSASKKVSDFSIH